MANWPQKVRDKLFTLLLAFVVAALVGLALTALWPLLAAIAHLGPVAWTLMAAPVLACVALLAWRRRVKDAHAEAANDIFSFSEWVVRMRAKEKARDLASHGAAS